MQKITNILGRSITGIYLQKHNDITEYFYQTKNKYLNENEFIIWKTN